MTLWPRGARAVPWLLALLPALLVVTIRWNAGPGRDVEDYAHYILHARNIVEGRPYGDIGCINSKYADFRCTPQPPGTPLTLAALFFVVGEHPLTTGLLMLALSLGFAVVAGVYFARWDPRLGVGVAMLTLLAPGIIRFAAHVTSDLPFALAAWLTILVADHKGPWTWRRVAGVTVLAFAAQSYRVLGVALVPGLLAMAVVRRKELGWRGFVPGACLGGALLLALIIRGVPFMAAAYAANLHLFYNLEPIRLGLSYALLYPFPWDAANDLYHVVATVVMALGLFWWLREGAWRTLGFWFAAAYLAALLVLPFMVPRYFWPLTPLVVFGLLRGVTGLAARVPTPRWKLTPAGLALGCATLIAIGAVADVLSKPKPGDLTEDPDTRALFATLQSWADSETVRPAFFKPRVLTLETGLRATSTFKVPPDSGRAMLERLCITHLVIGSDRQLPNVDRSLENLVQAFPDRFTLVMRNTSYRVYRLATSDSCVPVARPRPQIRRQS